jgi:adenine-specific DNA-methyltransferase
MQKIKLELPWIRQGRRTISCRNAEFFEAETDKLEGWADDLKLGLEREIKEIDRQIKEARRPATAALPLEEKLAGQKEIKVLESQRNQRVTTQVGAKSQLESELESQLESAPSGPKSAPSREEVGTK